MPKIKNAFIYIVEWIIKQFWWPSVLSAKKGNTFQFPLWWWVCFRIQVHSEDDVLVCSLRVLVHWAAVHWFVVSWFLLVYGRHVQQWQWSEHFSWSWCLQTVLVPSCTFQDQLSDVNTFHVFVSALLDLFLILLFYCCWVNNIIQWPWRLHLTTSDWLSCLVHSCDFLLHGS